MNRKTKATHKALRSMSMSLAILCCGFVASCTSFKKMYMIMGDDPVTDRAAAIERGALVYEANCIACHGDTGRGDGPAVTEQAIMPADLPTLAAQKKVNTFAANITYGKNQMPAYRGQLSEEQIWDVAHYVKAFAD